MRDTRSIVVRSSSHHGSPNSRRKTGLRKEARLIDANKQSGSSPTADFELQNHGSIFLLIPQNTSARIWVDDHIGRENGFQPYYPTIVIEHRYCAALIAQ